MTDFATAEADSEDDQVQQDNGEHKNRRNYQPFVLPQESPWPLHLSKACSGRECGRLYRWAARLIFRAWQLTQMTRRKKTKASRRRAPEPPTRRKRAPGFWAVTGGAIVALAAAVIAVSLTGGSGSESDLADERGPVHVHGLGVDPKNGALYVATHTGMWSVSRGQRSPEPVGESRQDTMGFTIAGPGHFLGSGHPNNLNQPPLLGLIESFDSGATWKPISLLGEADFHVLRAVGKRIYGYDVSHSRLMVSADRGKTWTERKPKAPLLDLAPDPTSPDRLLATTQAGLLASVDGGATWTVVGHEIGLLGWPAPEWLYLVAANGAVFRSANGGRAWLRVGAIGGQPAAFLAQTSRELYAAIHGGAIVQSRDGGRTWRAVTS
jgi:hypothetical protein